jgi:Tfp pilus assembly protein PilN
MLAQEKIEQLLNRGKKALQPAARISRSAWQALSLNLMNGIVLPETHIAASIERRGISIVKGSKFLSKVTLQDFKKYTFEEDGFSSPERVASTLSLALRELKSPRRAGMTLALPREWVIVRKAQLPSSVMETITAVVGFELDRLTPLGAENAYYDFRILDEEDGKINLVVVASRADLINQYLAAAEQEGIHIQNVTTNLSGIGTMSFYLGLPADAVCVDVDARGFEGGFFAQGTMTSTFGHIFDNNGQSRSDTLISALAPIFQTGQENNVAPQVVLFAKDAEYAMVQGRTGNRENIVNAHELERTLLKSGDALPDRASGIVLEALWPKARGFNLLTKGVHATQKVPLAITTLLILLLLAAVVPYVLLPLQHEQDRLAQIEKQISLLKPDVKKVEGLRKDVKTLADEVNTIASFKESKPMTLAMLKEITQLMPKSAWLTRVHITESNVDLEGYASSATELIPKLERSPYLKKVEFASPTFRDQRLNSDRFVIKAEIEGVTKTPASKTVEGDE